MKCQINHMISIFKRLSFDKCCEASGLSIWKWLKRYFKQCSKSKSLLFWEANDFTHYHRASPHEELVLYWMSELMSVYASKPSCIGYTYRCLIVKVKGALEELRHNIEKGIRTSDNKKRKSNDHAIGNPEVRT